MKKRSLLLLLFGFCAMTALARADEMPFDFDTLRYQARLLSIRPYVPPSLEVKVPDSLLRLTYDQYRDIRFKPEKAWWRREGLPFQLQFFHLGRDFREPVQISEVVGKEPRLIPFKSAFFDYGKNTDIGAVPEDMGYAGFRIHYPLNNPDYLDELAVFLGASYFRALGQNMLYGLSARGLAVNCGEPGGEEFPVFKAFWVKQPTPDAKQLIVYALLDSPSVTGAYRFIITPGTETVMQVRVTLYCRTEIKSLGLAPLTSMFWHGKNSNGDFDDYRPEVHDSDGLQIERSDGEWLWRPLVNPAQIRSTAFTDENPRGFGLVQRDRDFNDYQDLESSYQLRPSAWVEPVGQWGRGSVRLVELPTPNESNDNIVAFWVPEKLPPVGDPIDYEYKLHWFMEMPAGGVRPPAGYTVATRIGHSKTYETDLQRFVVDFDGPYLHGRHADPDLQPVITVGDGAKLVNSTLQSNPYNGTWRVAFALKPDGTGRPVELRCFLQHPPHILTETWSYLWNP
ncbi:MAG TPA: glucan biosynthesis protein G [Opitutaceae bacterium]|jgi:glucans biosynthesis protein|nr:glucan biosynthesis protein G [Opitutaceae bacterium]